MLFAGLSFFLSFPSFSLDNLEVFEDAVFVKSNHTYCFNFCVTLVLHPLFCFYYACPKGVSRNRIARRISLMVDVIECTENDDLKQYRMSQLVGFRAHKKPILTPVE